MMAFLDKASILTSIPYPLHSIDVCFLEMALSTMPKSDPVYLKRTEAIENALSHLPKQPGIYQMLGPGRRILYIGKAKDLSNRVKSYFQPVHRLLPKVKRLMEQVIDFKTIVTDSEVEALILEYNLIKQHKPKYNVLLKDDKKLPWIGLTQEDFPRVFITRTPGKRGKFFGPYVNSTNMYRTLEVVRKHFPLRQRKKPLFQSRPCMNYYIGACSGPCQNLVSKADYHKVVQQVEWFLKGKSEDLLEQLERDMLEASKKMAFELAAKIRDRHRAVQAIVQHQKMLYPDKTMNQDSIALISGTRYCVFMVLSIRRGRLTSSTPKQVLLTDTEAAEAIENLYTAFLMEHYEAKDPGDLPSEVLVSYELTDSGVIQDWLTQKKGQRVKISFPQKGLKKEMVQLAEKNAQQVLEQAEGTDIKNYRNNPTEGLMMLQEVLNLQEFPERIECYDISHFQGSQTVASMVVFSQGVPDKAAYRRFKIHWAEGKPDDFKSMAEVMTRRFTRAINQDEGWEEPSLVVIDGGKGQLSAACKALDQLGLVSQPIISLAKKFEEVFLPGNSRPILLPRDSMALFILQQIRDEAHRFAITYHRKLRGKQSTRSVLDDIAGVGQKRKQALLDAFGSVKKIQAASIAELRAVTGMSDKVVKAIYEALHPDAGVTERTEQG
ncbi:MAG: excinuclease ABC subunit UvrC [Cyanobacteria bacterium P01_H01_bin.74]